MENDAVYVNNKKFFDFKFIGIGLIFFIDFNVNTFDILPDVLGLVLISLGIGKTFYINENFLKAHKYINIFFISSGLKFILNIFYLIFGFNKFDDSFILLITTVFSSIELSLSMLIFSGIFKGFEDFSQWSGKLTHAKKSDYIILLLKIFIILKFCLAMIAQIPILITETTWDSLSIFFDLYLDGAFVKNLFIPPCFIIQTLIGIFFLSIFLPFFFEISKDRDLRDFIKSKINGVLISDNFFVLKRNLNFAFVFFMTGCIFFVDLQFDNINILPDFLICLFFLTGISIIFKTNPEIKNKRLNFCLLLNLFVSAFSYITGTLYKIMEVESLTGENLTSLSVLKISSTLSFHASVIIFFLIFIEFYSFIRNLQHKHLEFSIRYLNKYIPASEKNFDKNKNMILWIAAASFCVKSISVILPESGIVLFCHSVILIVFVFFMVKALYSTRNAVYSYYN